MQKIKLLKILNFLLTLNIELGVLYVTLSIFLIPFMALFMLGSFGLESLREFFHIMPTLILTVFYSILWIRIYWLAKKSIAIYQKQETRELIVPFQKIARTLVYSFCIDILFAISARLARSGNWGGGQNLQHPEQGLSSVANSFGNGTYEDIATFFMPTTHGMATIFLVIIFFYLSEVLKTNLQLKEENELTV